MAAFHRTYVFVCVFAHRINSFFVVVVVKPFVPIIDMIFSKFCYIQNSKNILPTNRISKSISIFIFFQLVIWDHFLLSLLLVVICVCLQSNGNNNIPSMVNGNHYHLFDWFSHVCSPLFHPLKISVFVLSLMMMIWLLYCVCVRQTNITHTHKNNIWLSNKLYNNKWQIIALYDINTHTQIYCRWFFSVTYISFIFIQRF